KKKKSLFFRTGPPSVAPNWLRISLVRGRPFKLLKKELASKSVLRLYSYAEPCQLLSPLLVERVICAPLPRPLAARGFAVSPRNSWIESTGAFATVEKSCPVA